MWHLSYKEEEYWNTGTHALGVLLGVIGAVLLLLKGKDLTGVGRMALWVYSISIIVLFSASTIYHAVADPRIKKKLRILDHISIYFLIAGTYTPVALITLREGS
ncbi:MAG: hemolysin III family protein, partial [Robiginitalea sp.]